MLKHKLGVVFTCIAVVSLNANAVIMNADWKTPGDNLITQDTGSGLEWLDLTVISFMGTLPLCLCKRAEE